MDTIDLYRLLRNAHLEAQGVMDTVRDPLVVLDGDLNVLNASRAFYETFGVDRDETIGQSFHALGRGQWDVPELRALLETVIPRSASVTDYEVQTVFPGIGRRTMLVSARRLLHPDTNNRVILLSIVDATERRLREDEKNIVIGELRHRIKNMFAVVASLARQTQSAGQSAEDYRDAFLGRLDALARANGFATNPAGAVQLSDVARATLEPYVSSADQIELFSSPNVSLEPEQVVPVSMILHELATNAVRHGALSAPEGRLHVGWTVESRSGTTECVYLTWRESGGPPVSAPESRGFGTRLIDFATVRDLGGSVERTYDATGLRVEVTFPL